MVLSYRCRLSFPVRSSVVVLFLSCSPAAIFGAIVTVHINAVNGQVFSVTVRHCPIMEGLKIVQPFGTHFDSPSAVILESCCGGVVTPFFHSTPDAVNACAVHSVFGFPVSH